MQHEHHRVPVTALAIWKHHHVILAGEGPYLRAYSIHHKTLLASFRAFPTQAIHGVVVHATDAKSHALVWGGHDCRIVGLHMNKDTLRLLPGRISTASDWILDAAFSDQQDSSHCQFALVTAHNALVVGNRQTARDIELQKLVTGSNCILYCAHVTWLSASRCLIASGTAFGDIVVWSCDILQDAGKLYAEHQTHYTYSAHQGSVFGVQLLLNASFTSGRRQHLLVSCSDDRAICLWDVSDLTKQSLNLAEQQRETGFGQTAPADKAHAPELLAKIMGAHLSRIWHVRFSEISQALKEQNSPTLSAGLRSFGEDAVTIDWALIRDLVVDENSPLRFKQLQSHKAHSGKNIWSVAHHPAFFATGGADGAIALSLISSGCEHNQKDTQYLPSDDAQGLDPYRSYAFVGKSTLLAVTNTGRILLLPLAIELSAPASIATLTNLRGYSVMAGALNCGVFAGADGNIHCYSSHSRQVSRLLETGRKVSGLFTSYVARSEQQAHMSGLYVCVTNVRVPEATVCLANESSSGDATPAKRLLRLLLPPAFITTSFACIREGSDTTVVLGSRTGSLAIYELATADDTSISPALVVHFVHGNESITSLLAGTKDEHCQDQMFFSTGRDGTYAAHTVVRINDRVALTTSHQIGLPFGPNVEGIGYASTGHIWTWGFRSKSFVVYDVTDQQEVMTVDCGGAHRTWAFQPADAGGTFVWTKASKLYYRMQKEPPRQLLNSGGHGREIKAAAVSRVDRRLIATGAEDTSIKLSVYEGGGFRCLHTLPKHTTGIQELKWSHDDRYLFSSGGFEEFFVWRIRRNVPGLHIGIVCESAHPNNGTSDLRIMSFDVQSLTVDADLDSFRITMVYSDSTIRAWRYSEKTWLLEASGDYLTSCLTQCLRGHDPETLLTASTDGHIAMWSYDETQQSLRWTQRHRIHQNAILSLVRHPLSDGTSLIITSGDDNAIGLTRDSNRGNCSTLLVPCAHAAAVTGLTIVDCTSTCIWLVSASIDQRIKLWRIDLDLNQAGIDGIDIKLLSNVPTAVADVSSIEQLQLPDGGRGILICGVGTDIWRVNDLKE